MTFALGLKESLRDRTTRMPIELSTGQSLEEVLNRHLRAVESAADTVLLTSILLLDDSGKRLWHAAAPSLPQTFCEAINGAEIGPSAGSCGTAAFKGHAVYVADIATDPLWIDYRHLAAPHGLRACWSTPIRDAGGVLVGTFAIYHLTPRGPTQAEVEAISMITGHVAQAIQASREVQDLARPAAGEVIARGSVCGHGNPASAGEARDILKSIEAGFATLGSTIAHAIDAFPDADHDALTRARRAAERGAEIARTIIKPR